MFLVVGQNEGLSEQDYSEFEIPPLASTHIVAVEWMGHYHPSDTLRNALGLLPSLPLVRGHIYNAIYRVEV